MPAVALLCEIMAQRAAVALRYDAQPSDVDVLRQLGLIKGAGTLQSWVCTDCQMPHNAVIVHTDGCYGYFCPDLGFLPVAAEDIEAVKVDMPVVVAMLAKAFDCRARKSTPVADALWRVGRVTTDAGDIAIYLCPSLQSSKGAESVEGALAVEPEASYRLILAATATMPLGQVTSVSLPDAVEIDFGKEGFRAIADLRDLVGAARKNSGGAPNRYREPLTQIIKARVSNGTALVGRNEEARAVLAEFKSENPHQPSPSLSSVQDYVSKLRAGQ